MLVKINFSCFANGLFAQKYSGTMLIQPQIFQFHVQFILIFSTVFQMLHNQNNLTNRTKWFGRSVAI